MTYDFSRINDRLFVGAQIKNVDDIVDIRAVGITHIIDLMEQEQLDVLNSLSGIALLWNPTADDGQHKGLKFFAPGIDFAVGALAHPGFAVLTHCQMGRNRGPSMMYAILRALGWSEEFAIQQIHTCRPATIGGVRYADDAEAVLISIGWIKNQATTK